MSKSSHSSSHSSLFSSLGKTTDSPIIKFLRYAALILMIILSGITVAGIKTAVEQRQDMQAIESGNTLGYTENAMVDKIAYIGNPSDDTSSETKRALIQKKIKDVKPTVSVDTGTVVLGGDIMLSRTIGYRNKTKGYERTFAGDNYNPIKAIQPCDMGKCLLLMNLESPFSKTDNDSPERTMRFKANPHNVAVLQGLRGTNTMGVSLANNHVNNAGGEGITTTIATLNEFGFYHVGANTTKESAREILTFRHNNIHRCIGGYSYDGNGGIYGGKPLYRNSVYLSGMLEDLERMKTKLHCDIKAVIVHWGTEYRMTPNKDQVSIAHTLVENGLDILIGGHAHVPGKVELYKGKYIFYSLGNALFDQDRGMHAVEAGMDTIYDYDLKKKTVPTYISIFPVFTATKNGSGTTLALQKIQTAKVQKGLFYQLDSETEKGLLQTIQK